MGREFTIIADHKSSTFLMNCNANNDHLFRGTLWLQQFMFTIEYCPGNLNVLPDFLSRVIFKEKYVEIKFFFQWQE